MKNKTLAFKILMGFGVLIVITCILGGLAVYDMQDVEKTALGLSKENVPEIIVANNVERYALSTMYAMRGYAFTESQQFLDQGKKHLETVKQYLKDAKAHGASSTDLTRLKEAAERAEIATLEYEKLAEETVKLTTTLEQERQSAESAAKTYMDLCYSFMKIQEDLLAAEISDGKESSVITSRYKNISLVNNIIDLGNWIIAGTWKSQFRRDPKLFAETKTLFVKVYQKLDELKAQTKDEQRLKMIEDCRAAGKAYEKNMEVFLATWVAREEITVKRGAAADRVLAEAKKTAEMGMEDTAQAADTAASQLSAASKVMIGGLALAAILGIGTSILITRSITKPINRVVDGLSEASEQVASASGQISSSSQHLAEGASEQAASLEETSSSLEEMASMTRQNAENANMARSKMAEAQSIIQRVSGHMDEMANAVSEITASSEQTSKIVKSIDEIAFQTNLLALNAAVEAARAGEAGAGFAVVADEVRNLAMRAADAAKTTSNLIESTIKAVKNGNDLTRLTQEAFKDNMEISHNIAQLVDEIATASQEQSHGIGQLNTAVADMDKVTQNVAANAEESASAGEEMNAQAEQLKSYVNDLKGLVGGKQNRDGRRASRSGASGRSKGSPDADKIQVFTKARMTPVKSNGKAMTGWRSGREVRAEQLIPFDDDKMGEF